MNKKSVWRRLLPAVIPLCAVLAGALLFTGALSRKADAEALALTERSLRRAAVECYALEGAYPRSLSVLTGRYGAVVDERRFFVSYQYVASNLMPDITVLPIRGEDGP